MKLNLLSGVALCVVGGVMAYADAAMAAEGDIIVTANRREQVLQDVPLAVSSLSADALQAKGISSLSDIQPGSIAGVSLNQFAGTPSIIAFSIRGNGNSDPTQGSQDNPVTIYVDGVAMSRGQGSGLELIEPERIEILRGPQGQLFGRNAEAGVVQYISKKPSGKFGFDASASLGNYDAQKYRLRVDLPEIAGVSLQIAGIHSEREAYTTNPNKGTYSQQADYGELKGADGFRIAARWAPTQNLLVDYVYDDSQTVDSQPVLSWIPVDALDPATGLPRTPSAAIPPSTETERQLSVPLYNEYFNSKSKGHALTIDWSVSDAITLKSISSYREASRHGGSTLSDGLGAGVSVKNAFLGQPFAADDFIYPFAREDLDSKQTSQELQFLGSWDRLDLTVGVIYFHEDTDDGRKSTLTGPGFTAGAGNFFFIPGDPDTTAFLNSCIGQENCITSLSKQSIETNSYGAYAQATYTPPILDDKLELTAGIRYSDDTKDFQRTVPALINSSFTEQRWDPAFTVKYKWTPDINTYFRYATAYRSGGSNVRSSTFLPFDAEELESFELGAKSRLFDKRVTLNGALYHNIIKGQQLGIQENFSGNPALVSGFNRAGDYDSTGLELELTANVTKAFTIGASWTHVLDSTGITEFDNPLTAAVGDTARFYPITEPEDAGSVSLDYTTQSFPVGELRLHTDYSFSTAFWNTPGGLNLAGLGPNFQRPTSDTSQLGARVSWVEIPLGNTQAKGEVALWGKNLLDNESILYGFDGGALGGGFATYRVTPLTAGVEFRVKY